MKKNSFLKEIILSSAAVALALPMPVSAQTQKVSLNFRNVSPRQLFRAIEKQTTYRFSFRDMTVDQKKDITVNCKEQTVKSVLEQVLAKRGLTYKMVSDKDITVMPVGHDAATPQTKPAQQRGTQKKNKMVRGHIVDDHGEPIVGAVVRVKGTTRGVSTDIDGNFQIEASHSDQLDVTYIGFQTQNVKVDDNVNYDIRMAEDKKQIEEVVVTAYGSGQKKASVVGSIETLDPGKLQAGSTRSLSNNLAGQVAGVIAVQRSGEPGYDNSNFWIRGISTFSGNQNPLVLIDGVERDLNNIDPAEIESFSVLKDASASAMYGVRGANGVIIITTKRGKVGKPTTDIRVERAISKPTRLPDFLDGPARMRLRNELQTDKTYPYYSDEDIRRTEVGYDPDLYPNINWIDAVTNDYAYNTRANVTVNGGSDFLRYALIASWYNENGIITRDKSKDYDTSILLNRYNVRANVDVDLTKTTLLRLNIGGYLQERRGPSNSVNQGLYYAMTETPIAYPPIYSDGTVPRRAITGTYSNPWGYLTQFGKSETKESQIQALVSLEQKLDMITKGLKLKASFAFDSYQWVARYRKVNPTTYAPATGRDAFGNLIHEVLDAGDESMSFSTASNYGNRRTYIELGATYQRTFGQHDIDALLLYNQQSYDPGSYQSYRKQGMAGRLSYTFGGKYVAEFNFGYNGSENFAKGHRFGFFPSGAIGWLPSEEKFWSPMSKYVNKLKFRASYGKVGNDDIGGRRFAYITTVNTSAGSYLFGEKYDVAYGGLTDGQVGVPNLTWETAWKQNYGVELGLLNMLELHLDYFIETRSNIFMQRRTTPGLLGFAEDPWANYGKVRNKGYEATLNFNHHFGKDFFLNLRASYSYARNKILEIDEPAAKKGTYRAQTGHSMNEFYGLVAERLYEASDFDENGKLLDGIPKPELGNDVNPGDIKYADLNNDGIVNSEDCKYLGHTSDPRGIYGFGASMSYKNLDFSFFFQGNYDTWNMLHGDLMISGIDTHNFYSNASDRWTEQNPSQNVFYPRAYENVHLNNTTASTWWLKRQDMCRLKTVELGYSLPKSWLERIHVQSTRFFVSGNNLLLLSGWKLWDPELNSNTGTVYPPMKSVLFGVELTF